MKSNPDWTPDQEQYYLENPDEWPESDPDLDEVDDDEALSEDDFHHDLDPYGEEDPDWDPPLQDAHGLTADGYDLLAEMDAMRDFI
jgi:hypothetical protein